MSTYNPNTQKLETRGSLVNNEFHTRLSCVENPVSTKEQEMGIRMFLIFLKQVKVAICLIKILM